MRLLTLLLAGLVAVGCDSPDKAAPQADRPEVDTADPNSVDAVAGGTTPETDAETVAAVADGGDLAGIDLAAYAGKYPFDKVNGLTFFDQPAVKTAVAAAIPDKTVLGWVMGEHGGPSAPIEVKSGKIASWACEQHNCGDHQWTVLVDPAGRNAEVCYQDVAALPGKTRWYRAGAAPETRDGTCQL